MRITMTLQPIVFATVLSLAGAAQADVLFESGGFTLAANGQAANGAAMTGSSEGLLSNFTLAQRSTVQRIVFASSLDAAALDPASHTVLPTIDIRSGSGVAFLGTSYEREAGATLVAGSPYNLVSFEVGGLASFSSLVLDAGTYQIYWNDGQSVMPTYTVPGSFVVQLNPLGHYTLVNTALAFQVQGVSAVPEPQAGWLLLAGLLGLGALARLRRAA
jgi:hypothetical protein